MSPSRPFSRLLRLGMALSVSLGLMATEEPKVADPKIAWQEMPGIGKLGSQAEIKLPAGYLFTGGNGTRQFLEMSRNMTNGSEAGMFMPRPEKDAPGRDWFVVFEYWDAGHVKDDEKDKLDADALLKSIREGTEAENEERKKRGWPTLHVESWSRAPYYDRKTHNLTWGTLVRNSKGQQTINYTTRMLGRRGYMQVDLVADPDSFDIALVKYTDIMQEFQFVQGERYAEFKKGDKVAEIGLGALVVGGTGAILAKSGLLGKLWKFIAVGAAGVAAWFKRLFSGKKDDQDG